MAKLSAPGRGEEAVGRVVKEIREMIIGAELLPGQQIRQEHMAVRLGLSRLPVREALCQLAADGLVVHERNVGYTVARLCRSDFDQIYLMRRLLESEVIRSLTLPDPALANGLERLNHELEAAEAEMDIARARVLNKEFHFAFFRLSRLGLVVAEIERIWDWAMPHQSVSLRESGDRIINEHYAMVGAVRTGSVDDLVALMDRHRAGSAVHLSGMLQTGRRTESAAT